MNNLKIGISIVGSAVLAYTTALLTAPRSGKETRKLVKNEMTTAARKLEKTAKNKLEDVKLVINKTIEEKAEESKENIESLKEDIKVA